MGKKNHSSGEYGARQQQEERQEVVTGGFGQYAVILVDTQRFQQTNVLIMKSALRLGTNQH